MEKERIWAELKRWNKRKTFCETKKELKRWNKRKTFCKTKKEHILLDSPCNVIRTWRRNYMSRGRWSKWIKARWKGILGEASSSDKPCSQGNSHGTYSPANSLYTVYSSAIMNPEKKLGRRGEDAMCFALYSSPVAR